MSVKYSPINALIFGSIAYIDHVHDEIAYTDGRVGPKYATWYVVHVEPASLQQPHIQTMTFTVTEGDLYNVLEMMDWYYHSEDIRVVYQNLPPRDR